MSEFTTGNLFLAKQVQSVESFMQSGPLKFVIHPLNESWSALLVEDDWLSKSATVSLLLELSKQVPLLNFRNAEDHGWGYRVFVDGNEIASFFDDYQLLHGMIITLAEQRYPQQEDITEFLYFDTKGKKVFAKLLTEVKRSKEYQDKLSSTFLTKNVQAFKHFGIDPATIAALERLISPEALQDEPPHGEVSTFQNYLGITGMEWMSYRYMKRDNK